MWLSMKPISRRWRTAIWLTIWLAAFVVTHMPPPEKPAPPVINDKIMHFTGFTMLSIVTVWGVEDERRPLMARTLLFWFLVLVVYGFVDERTQPFMGRSFEWLDWAADTVGAVCGLTIGFACSTWTRKHRAANRAD